MGILENKPPSRQTIHVGRMHVGHTVSTDFRTKVIDAESRKVKVTRVPGAGPAQTGPSVGDSFS